MVDITEQYGATELRCHRDLRIRPRPVRCGPEERHRLVGAEDIGPLCVNKYLNAVTA